MDRNRRYAGAHGEFYLNLDTISAKQFGEYCKASTNFSELASCLGYSSDQSIGGDVADLLRAKAKEFNVKLDNFFNGGKKLFRGKNRGVTSISDCSDRPVKSCHVYNIPKKDLVPLVKKSESFPILCVYVHKNFHETYGFDRNIPAHVEALRSRVVYNFKSEYFDTRHFRSGHTKEMFDKCCTLKQELFGGKDAAEMQKKAALSLSRDTEDEILNQISLLERKLENIRDQKTKETIKNLLPKDLVAHLKDKYGF